MRLKMAGTGPIGIRPGASRAPLIEQGRPSMQRNANVGSKLLALIAVPAVVLVAVASLGALQRVDEADEAKQTEIGARLAASTTDLAHQLQVERLLTMRLVAGDDEVAGALSEARAATDEAVATFTDPTDAVGDESVGRRYEAAAASVQLAQSVRSLGKSSSSAT